MWRYLIPVALFVTLVWFFARGLYLDPGYVPSPFVGKPAPAFSLPKLKDPAARLERSDIVGELALVNVWATWCIGCQQEHAFLVQLASSAGLPIYGLNWKDDRSQALRWLEQLGDPYVASGFDASGDTAICRSRSRTGTRAAAPRPARARVPADCRPTAGRPAPRPDRCPLHRRSR